MKKRTKGWMICVLAATLLSGCGDGSEEASAQFSSVSGMPEAVQIDLTDTLAQPDTSDTVVRLLYQTGELTQEQEAAISDVMESLRLNLEAAEYYGEGIHMVCSPEFEEVMTPGLYEGGRSYTLSQGGKVLLSVQVGYTISGDFYANVCYRFEDDKLTLLKQEGSRTSLLLTGLSGSSYDGALERWLIDSATGEIEKEEGTYTDGKLTGDYTVSKCQAAAGDAFDLWTNREQLEYDRIVICYDENGQPMATPTPEPTATPAATPTTTKKPAAQPTAKPTQAPVQTQAPTPAPTPEPQQDDDDDDDDNSSDNNSGGDTSQPSQGETDVEWTPDI